jgi:choline-sulfatase
MENMNIIFILTDDQGIWAAGCYGNPEIRTPNIDHLAQTGVRFNNFFCASPVCSPARASLLTGMIPSQHGVHDWIRDGNMPPDPSQYLEGLTCYTDILVENGHTCGLSGKWHLGDSLLSQHGFSHWFSHQYGAGTYNDAPMVRNGKAIIAPGYVTDVITDDSLDFIERHKDQPFYLSVHYTAPHSPWTGHPRDIVESYDNCPFESCPQEPLHPGAGPLTRASYGNRELLKGYFAAVTAMDENMGRIIKKLEELNLREKTLIVFSSDNGFSCGHHGFWGKGNGTFPLNMYENSIKVPMIFSHPGTLHEGHVVEVMASQYDFMPTLLDYLGIERIHDDSLPGQSFVSALKGNHIEGHERIVIFDEYGPVRMIRTREWKYVHRYPYGFHELYDLVHDPFERNNLIDDSSKTALIKELRHQLTSWFAKYVNPRMDGTRFPVTGSGQKHKIQDGISGEDSFYTDRLIMDENGVLKIDPEYDLKKAEKGER